MKKILNLFGLVKISEIKNLKLPREVIDSLVVNNLSLGVDKLTKKDEKKLFEDLASVDGFLHYLEYLMDRDVKRFFKLPYDSVEQKETRGAFARMYTLRSLCTFRKPEDKPVLESKRYIK
jgi:hypothetical protein